MFHCKGAMVATVLFAPLAAQGAIINEFVPNWRGQPETVYAGWESYMSGYGGFNIPDQAGSACACSLFNFGAGSVLDDDGNIDSAVAGLNVMVSGGQFSTQRLRSVVVNLATINGAVTGQQIKLRLVAQDGTISYVFPSVVQTQSEIVQADGSIHRSVAYKFGGDGYLSSGAVAQWRIQFLSGMNATLDAVAVDLDFNPVPAPGAIALAALAAGMIRPRRR